MLLETYVDKAHTDQRVDELYVELQLLFYMRRGRVPRLDPLLVIVVPIKEPREELFILEQVNEKLRLIESESHLRS